MTLRQNTDPIKVVPQAVRDAWASKPEHRCQWEDGRGRCRAYTTTLYRTDTAMLGTTAGLEWRCWRHQR